MHRLNSRVVALMCLVSASAHAAHDCAQGKRDFALAKERIVASANDEATVLLNQSIDECPSYEGYETLAEHLAQSDSGRDRGFAADAFVAAHARASSSKDRAQTLFQYAALLNREGDPQNAYPLVQQARALDPSRSAITSLAATIDEQIQHPKAEQITRALRYSIYKPLKYGSVGRKSVSSDNGPSVNIRINFETNSTVVDEQTRANVSELADALAGDALAGRHITFIGHSDVRGDAAYNDALSRQRAEAISESIVELKPQLKGMIRVEGHGAREPINLGTDEESLRANRRLQVVAK